MSGITKFVSEKFVHLVFTLSLITKGIFAVAEVIGGVFAYFITQQFLVDIASTITRGELLEDPHDVIANYLIRAAHSASISTQHFTALYLLSHGAIKLWLIIGLLRQRLWYYLVAIVVFGLFIAYQLYRYTFTHSVFLIFLTIIDLIVIVLTWHEYRYLRARVLSTASSSH
jgi:uncharacterized membrane protein